MGAAGLALASPLGGAGGRGISPHCAGAVTGTAKVQATTSDRRKLRIVLIVKPGAVVSQGGSRRKRAGRRLAWIRPSFAGFKPNLPGFLGVLEGFLWLFCGQDDIYWVEGRQTVVESRVR